MAESILVTGKKISSMELVTNVIGNEKIPTGQPDDLALTPNQIADHTITRGDLASQEDLSQVEVSLGTQIADLESDVTSADNSIRGLIASEEAARIAKDLELQQGLSDEAVLRIAADADLAREISVISDNLSITIQTFTSPEAGVDPVTGVADGVYYNVRSTEDDTMLVEYQNVGGVATPSGKSYPSSSYVQGIEEYTAMPFVSGKQYHLNQSIMLDNGDIVKNTIEGNTANPNIDMTGWVNQSLATFSTNKNLFLTQARAFTDFTSAVDAAPIISAYANSLSDGDTFTIPQGKWAIKSPCIINKAVNIKCDGELVVSGDSSAYVSFETTPVFTLTGSDLTQLPKKGDTKLHLVNQSLFDSSTHFFTLESTEVEIVRIGYAAPYYKNETLDFIDSRFTIRGQIDLDYNDPSRLTIKVYKKQHPHRIQLNLSMIPNAGQTVGARILNTIGASNIVWDLVIDRTTSQKVGGTSFAYRNSINFTFLPSCSVLGGQSDSDDSYAHLNTTSSYIMYYGGTYFDVGQTTKKERGYAARHGKYVYFQNALFNGVDDHYGHWYTIKDMTFVNRGIGFSGGTCYVENVYSYAKKSFLFALRGDTPYADGKLTLKNCHALGGLLYAECTYGSTYNSKYKTWDEILIEDSESYSDLLYSHALRFSGFYSFNENTQTTKLTVRGFNFKRQANMTSHFLLTSAGSVNFKNVVLEDISFSIDGVETTRNKMASGINASESITLKNVAGIDGTYSAPVINISDKSKLGYTELASVVLIATDKLIISDSEISDDASLYGSASNHGKTYLYNNRITGNKFFVPVSLSTRIEAAFGNSLATGVVPNFSGDLRNYQKIKPVRYLQDELALGTLAVGAVSPVQTVTVLGAMAGDPIDSAIVTNPKGLRVNAWVSANDTVQYYVENPVGNPVGSLTFSTIAVRLTVRSN